jgi:hypothetical protein
VLADGDGTAGALDRRPCKRPLALRRRSVLPARGGSERKISSDQFGSVRISTEAPMPKKRHSPEGIVSKLRQADAMVAQGQPIATAVRCGPGFRPKMQPGRSPRDRRQTVRRWVAMLWTPPGMPRSTGRRVGLPVAPPTATVNDMAEPPHGGIRSGRGFCRCRDQRVEVGRPVRLVSLSHAATFRRSHGRMRP